ncbi:MAG TPA: hypothetical protein PKJ08_04445 [Candidatus Cloacimonadota bacterium]|nr:hypothetical protein [Candidatus Cloacimonadota bacterium]HPM01632.1 hypothetical protein [Candidatus Cloacimonadota bacterium]
MTSELQKIFKDCEQKYGKSWINDIMLLTTKEELDNQLKQYELILSAELLDEAFNLLINAGNPELTDDELLTVSGGVHRDDKP